MDNLFIGIIESEEQIEDQSSDCNSFKINKIGGYPVLSPNTTKDVINSFNSLVCDLCQKRLTFVLQIYCPIDDSPNDRLIYIFVCINDKCLQNKWFAIRTVTSFVNKIDNKQENSPQNNIWIEEQSDWGTDDMEEDMSSQTDTCAQSLTQLSLENNKYETIVLESMAYFQPLYVSVIEEPSDSGINDKHINHLIESYERNNSEHKSSDNSGETYETNYLQTIYRNDRKNYEFFKRLSICPKQIIRYQWMETPLVNSDNHKLITSKCDSCGADRSFEFQLMPALIPYLKSLSDRSQNCDIDFGTVLIYCCSQNCVKNNGFAIEETVLLLDPDNELINKIKE